MKAKFLTMAALAMAVGFCACDNDDDKDDTSMNISATDSAFVKMAGMGNTAEIEASKIADSLSDDADVKAFAQMMIADHTLAQAQLKTLAAKYGLTAPDSTDAMHKEIAMQLRMKSGRELDSMYIHQQVVDHNTTIVLFQNEASNGNNVVLKDSASAKLPTLQMHLTHATMVAEKF